MYSVYEEHIEILERENEKLEEQLLFYQKLIEYKTYGPPIHSREELNNKKQFCPDRPKFFINVTGNTQFFFLGLRAHIIYDAFQSWIGHQLRKSYKFGAGAKVTVNLNFVSSVN